MKFLATMVMRGRLQAMMIATAFAVLSLIFPPFSYLSGAVLALVTLRNGVNEGLVLMVASVLIMAVLSMIATGTYVISIAYLLAVWLPIYLMSLVLRRTVSLPLTLSAAGAMGIVAVLLLHGMLGDPIAWWKDILTRFFDQSLLNTELPEGVSSVQEVVDAVAQTMTALMASAFVLSLIFSLFIGRWWQATLYNPGGFKDEFHDLKLDKATSIFAMAMIALAMIGPGLGSLPADLSAVAVAVAGIPGLALVHDWVRKTNGSVAWLVAIYVLMAFAMPQMMAALCLAAILDAWLDIRRYFKPKTP